MAPFSSLVLPFLISSSVLLGLPCMAAAGGLRITLFHRDSLHSPFFNESQRPWDRVRAAVHRSNARANHLYSISRLAASSTSESASKTSISSNLIVSEQEYLMSLSLGTPPVEILAYPDTGSDLIWTQCTPCNQCYEQDSPLFDPRASSTYRNLSCSNDACIELEGNCDGNKNCRYSYNYEDKSFTSGVLASETFTFDSPDKGKVSIPGISFGCAHHSGGIFNNRSAGLVGLSRGITSLVRQLGSSIDGKFSYCLVSPMDSNASSNLNFGDAAVVTGAGVVTTPVLSDMGPYDYYLSLDEITVGDTRIAVRKTASMEDDTAVILVDSGTTLTYLRPDIVNKVKSALTERVHLQTVEDSSGEFELCFQFGGAADEAAIPNMVFGFRGGNVTLGVSNTFVPMEEGGARCLGILSSQETDGDAIFGSWAQQNFHIGFDLEKNVMSFAHTECSKL